MDHGDSVFIINIFPSRFSKEKMVMTIILEVNQLVKKYGLGHAGHARPGIAAAGIECHTARGGGAAGLCRRVLHARDIVLQVRIRANGTWRVFYPGLSLPF